MGEGWNAFYGGTRVVLDSLLVRLFNIYHISFDYAMPCHAGYLLHRTIALLFVLFPFS